MPTGNADLVVIDASIIVPVGAAPEIAEEIPIARRPRMEMSVLLRFDFTGGCPRCVHLQAGLSGSRSHSETRRSRIEKHLDDTVKAVRCSDVRISSHGNSSDRMTWSRRTMLLLLLQHRSLPRGSWADSQSIMVKMLCPSQVIDEIVKPRSCRTLTHL